MDILFPREERGNVSVIGRHGVYPIQVKMKKKIMFRCIPIHGSPSYQMIIFDIHRKILSLHVHVLGVIVIIPPKKTD